MLHLFALARYYPPILPVCFLFMINFFEHNVYLHSYEALPFDLHVPGFVFNLFTMQQNVAILLTSGWCIYSVVYCFNDNFDPVFIQIRFFNAS